MPDRVPPKILLLEADDGLAGRIKTLLTGRNWEVRVQNVSKEALVLLDTSKATPFDLFISSYQLPRMAGDDVLKAAKAISPLTQRMLMVPANQSDLVIRAINKAEINACLVIPFSDEDLLSQVVTCLDAFRKNLKLERFRRVTVHQNRQMFQIAQKLRKKDKLYQDKISEKKAEILRLRSRLNTASAKQEPASLPQRILGLGIALEPQSLKKEFLSLADYMMALVDSAAARTGLDREGPPRLTLPDPDAQDPPERMAHLSDLVIAAALASPADGSTVSESLVSDDTEELDEVLDITLSGDRTEAFACFKTPAGEPRVTLNDLLGLFQRREISFGILDDGALEAWLDAPGDQPFCVARGEKPVPGRDGKVTYTFETDYTNPGKIQDDGRIDFHDRGSIPFVTAGEILATKTPPAAGQNGVSVSGDAIVVDEPFDPVFISGSGTTLSEDGLTITAALDGQPHLGHLGEISVNPELPIEGDVDFQTGNIEFKGNIIVSGTVKEGFTVKGFSLTAKEVEGATIDLTGDLHVSDGITDSDIVSSGNIYAKFINNSRVRAFGNICIQKEIIDSEAIITGACENTSGVIISSKVSAKGGIEAGKIGTESSKPARLKVGVNEHLDQLTEQLEGQLKASVDKLAEIRDKIREVEDKDQDLYGQITEKAQVQEAAQNKIKTLKQEMEAQAGGGQNLAQLAARYKAEEATARTAELELNRIFEVQNTFVKQIADYKEMTGQIEETNKQLMLRKKGLREFSDRTATVPVVTVAKSIAQDTVITGPNVSHTMREDRRRCRIEEQGLSEEGLKFYEMQISDLAT